MFENIFRFISIYKPKNNVEVFFFNLRINLINLAHTNNNFLTKIGVLGLTLRVTLL